jgi:predicted small lipoprotein YifL
MTKPFAAFLASFGVLAFASAGCGKPKQAEVPDADKETGSADMAGEEAATKPAEDDKPAGENDMRDKCCASCQEALKTDRSGQAADQIPCADFTAAMSPWCLEYFRAHPTKAAECSPAK